MGQASPQNNLRLLHWQMLLLLLVTGYPSYSAPYFPVNSKVNSALENQEGRAAASVPDFPRWQQREDRNLPLWAQVHPEDLLVLHWGAAGFIRKVKHTTPIIWLLFSVLLTVVRHQPNVLCIASENLWHWASDELKSIFVWMLCFGLIELS